MPESTQSAIAPGLQGLRMHACALNARDLESLSTQAVGNAACICDGEWVGEGPAAVQQALEKELAVNDELFARVETVNGSPAVVEFDARGTPRATLHFLGDPAGRIRELRIEHGPRPGLRTIVPEPGR